MQLYAMFIAFVYCFMSAYSSICNKNTNDVEACIHDTSIQCSWNLLTVSCQKANGINYGCVNSLNRLACVRQLYSFDNSSILKQCFFGQRCQDASIQQLSVLSCSAKLSKYACTSITTPDVLCKWQDGQCKDIENLTSITSEMNTLRRCQNNSTLNGQPTEKELDLPEDELDVIDELEEIIVETVPKGQYVKTQSCQKDYNQSVNSNVCANLAINQACQHGGQSDQFKCINVRDEDLLTMNCSTSGLNQYGCLSIGTPGQQCVYQKGLCSLITSTFLQNVTCYSLINRLACIGFTDLNQTCHWNTTSQICQYITNFGLPCNNLTNVSISTCTSSTDKCMYNTTSGGCRLINDNLDNCSSIGISQFGCLKLNQTCRFDTQCHYMSKQDLNTYRCDSGLTKVSCFALGTPGQLCQWSEASKKCSNINILPDQKCTSFLNVNGNLCQAVTLDGCKYDTINNNCITSLTNDTCTTFNLNIVGCVEVSHKRSVCGWIEDFQQCQDITVISGITKCIDLKNVNAAACSQVYRPEINFDERNCRYNAISRGCVTYPALDFNADCTDSGLNQYGCVSVVKDKSWCRWQNNACIAISSQVEVQSLYCLNLQQVNAEVCSLVLAGGERCKYEPVSNNCITTVDIYADNCGTDGLNSYGCESIRSQKCYFDLSTIQCKATTDLSLQGQDLIFQFFTCQGNFLTQKNCLAVQTINQLCHWDSKQSLCVNINLTDKDQCLDVTQVNSNTCAAIQAESVSPKQSYCIYNDTTNLCSVAKVGGLACSTPGLNIYSCSAMTSTNSYCYFDQISQRCKELNNSLNKESEIQRQLIILKMDCAQLNSKACPLNDWSVNQKCFYNSTFITGLCINLDFVNDIHAKLYNCTYFQNLNITVSPYVCAAITATRDYCMYDSFNQRCQSVIEYQTCLTPYLNIKSCLSSTWEYCEWDPNQLKCMIIENDFLPNKVCTDLINEITCTNIESQICQFNETLGLCQVFVPVTNLTMCTDLASFEMTYSPLACQEITKPGQFCEYNTIYRVCQVQVNIQSNCTRQGINQGSCFARTPQIGCYWDYVNKICQDTAKLLQSDTNGNLNVSCTYGINKFACLNLVNNSACQWDLTLGQCNSMVVNNLTGCADLNQKLFHQNSFSCQIITKLGQNCYYDIKSNTCNNFSQSYLKRCTDYVRNINSCLQLTIQPSLYCIWNPISLICSPVSKANLNQVKCSDPVNQNICLDTTSSSCKWDTILMQCSNFSSFNIQCSSLTNGSNLFNRMTCVSQTYNGTVQDLSLQDQINCQSQGLQSDYCQYNAVTKLCEQIFRQTYNNISGQCDQTYEYACDNKLNYMACIKLTIHECYFTDQCRTSLNKYNEINCSQANQFSCPLITNPSQLCTYNLDYKICQVYPGNQFTPQINSCWVGDSNNIVNSNVCKNILNDHCTWDQSNQVCIQAQSITTYLCSDPGINKGTCNDYTNNTCNFSKANQCQGPTTYYATCSEVNNLSGAKILCSKITQQACFYDTTHNQCAQVIDFTLLACNLINVFNLNACIQITHIMPDGSQNFCVFDPSDAWCYPYTFGKDQPSSVCVFSNKFACLNFTTSTKFCVWVTNPVTSMGSCQEYYGDSLNSYSQMSLVGSCSNVSIQACFQVQSALQCKLVNKNICQDITTNDTNVNSCSKMNSINDVVCANFSQLNNIKQYCQFQPATLKNQTSYCVPSGKNLNCDAKGLNIYSCIELTWLTVGTQTTGAECQWNSTLTQCLSIQDPTYYNNGSCTALNKNACANNMNVLQPCVWSDSTLQCSGPVNCSAYTSIQVSQYVCSEASDVACKYDTINNVCQVMQKNDTPVTQCGGALGVNKLGCLTQTPGLFCQWILNQYTCYSMDESANICTDELNIQGCISIAYGGQNCNYNRALNKCQNFLVTSATSLAQVTDNKFKYNPQTCSNVTMAGVYIAYDQANQICISLTNATHKCSKIGINKLGCLSMTKQPCQYNLKTRCSVILSLSGIKCDPSYSVMTCQLLTGQGCQYKNDLCSPVSQTNTCLDLSIGTITNIEACARINNPSDFCQYDQTNHRCMAVINNQSQCETVGINQQGCINQTSSYCRFDNYTFSCRSEDAFNQYYCNDLVNSLNCLSITTYQQACQYNQQCSPFTIDVTTDCPTQIQVNSQACILITKPLQTCIYNIHTRRCQTTDNQTKCNDPFMNKIGCLQIITPNQKCQWDDEQSLCQDFDNIQQVCSSSVNQAACLSIDPSNYNCIWQDGSCNTLTGSPNCVDLVLINSPQACQIANDACRYNTTTNSCQIIKFQDPMYPCNQVGLSQVACQLNTLDKLSCIFDTLDHQCYLPSVFTICSQAQSATECVTVLDSCQWLNNLCLTFTQINYPCQNSIPQLITRLVCKRATVNSAQNTCSYVTTYHTINDKITILTSYCLEKKPLTCFSSEDQTSCVRIVGQPCIWNQYTNKCSLIILQKYPGIYTCASLGISVSQRACVDLIRIGEYCTYIQNQCLRVDPYAITTFCNKTLNFDACTQINSGQQKCIWNTVNISNIIQDEITANNVVIYPQITYQYGNCQVLVDLSTTNCSIYLNIYSCLQITTPGQYCQWRGYLCSVIQLSNALNPLPIKMQDYTIVNSNVCTLVNQDGESVKFDSQINACVQSDYINDNCITPGLNKAGCLNVTKQGCKWNNITMTCGQYKPNSDTFNSCLQVDKRVNSFVCSQIITAGLKCTYNHVNTECIDTFLDTQCDGPGLNQEGCLSLMSDSCSWQNNHCIRVPIIQDFTSCEDLPFPTNPYSCQRVSYFTQFCKYDLINQKCVSFDLITLETCLTRGLNLLACSSITTGFCQFANGQCSNFTNKDNYCRSVGQGNAGSCSLTKQSVDKCKFDPLNLACGPSGYYDVCSTPGINSEGCNFLKGCSWLDSTKICQCISAQKQLPSCSSMTNALNCKARKDCVFSTQENNDAAFQDLKFDHAVAQQYDLKGVCKSLSCSDMKLVINNTNSKFNSSDILCKGSLDSYGKQCLASSVNSLCRSISSCEEISIADLGSYDGCSSFYFEGKPCQNTTKSQHCSNFVKLDLYNKSCSSFLTSADCNKRYCVFTIPNCQTNISECLDIQCEDLGRGNCAGIIAQKTCVLINNTCQGIITCEQINYISLDLIKKEQTCNQIKQDGRQCGWVQTSISLNSNQCSSITCRYVGYNQQTCSGVHVLKDVCVMVKSNCVSCEEINDSCTCLKNSPYCAYDPYNFKCFSVPCSSYLKKRQCLNVTLNGMYMCQYVAKIKQCQPQCSRLFSKTICNSGIGCGWSDLQKLCKVQSVIVQKIKLVAVQSLCSNLIIYAIMINILLLTIV